MVRDNNVDQALKVLKKKMQREGIFRELKRKAFYEKPSERKAREKGEAIRRGRKMARKQMQREGLLPMPKKLQLSPVFVGQSNTLWQLPWRVPFYTEVLFVYRATCMHAPAPRSPIREDDQNMTWGTQDSNVLCFCSDRRLYDYLQA